MTGYCAASTGDQHLGNPEPEISQLGIAHEARVNQQLLLPRILLIQGKILSSQAGARSLTPPASDNPKFIALGFYSVRRASIGSVLAALRAGITAATKAAATSTAVVMSKTTGS